MGARWGRHHELAVQVGRRHRPGPLVEAAFDRAEARNASTSRRVPGNDFTTGEKVTLRRLVSHAAGLTVHGFGGYPADAAVPALVQVLDGQQKVPHGRAMNRLR